MTTDGLGLLQVPAPSTDIPVGDPALGYLLAFFKQCLVNNLGGGVSPADPGSAWGKVMPGQNVVTTTDARDPRTTACTTNEFPALFIARAGSAETQWRASDYACVPTKLLMWWVWPPMQLAARKSREPIANAARAAVEFQSEWVGRAKGYVVPGDTDPRAASLGSLVMKYAGLWYLHWKKSELVKIPVNMGTEGKKAFDAVLWTMEIGERLSVDPTSAARTFALNGYKDSIANGDASGAAGKTIVSLEGKLRITSISPSSGTHAGGTAVTIVGTQFMPGATVTIGGAAATGVSVSADATLITATTPAGTVGAADVVVTNGPTDSVTLAGGYTYT